MLFTHSLLAALSAATAMAVRHRTRDTSAGAFEITSFYDSGSPHSLEALISFQVSDASVNPPLAKVTCTASLAIQPSVATAPFGTKCVDPSVFFGLETGPTGYFLTIAHSYDGNKTTDSGSMWLGDDVETFVDTLNPNGDYQYLKYSTAFEVGYNRLRLI